MTKIKVRTLVIAIIAALFAVADLHAQSWTYPTSAPVTPFAGGTGTADNPYQITTAQQLANMSYLVNTGGSTSPYNTACYKVMNDIDLAGTEWTPVSKTTFPGTNVNDNLHKGKGFMGKFDGGGFTISNLTKTDVTQVGGLFGNLSEGADIRNFTITGNITSNVPSGAVAGLVYCTSKTAAHVVVDAVLSSVNITQGGSTNNNFAGNAGGILGSIYQGTAEVFHCGYFGKMTRNSVDARLNAIVGLAGQSDNDNKVLLYINNCFNATKDIPGSTNNTNSEKWGNLVYYRASTGIVFMGTNNYSACKKNQNFEKVNYLDDDKLKSGEMIWELNENDKKLEDGKYVSGNTKYWAYDENLGIPRPVPVVFDPDKYHPLCAITVISSFDDNEVGVFYTDKDGHVVYESVSPTATYYLDKECTKQIKPLKEHVFDDDCIIYEVELMVVALKPDGEGLKVQLYLRDVLQETFPVEVTDDDGNTTSYDFSYEWYLNNAKLSCTTSACPFSGDGTYEVVIKSDPANYKWNLRYIKGVHKVYCKPSSTQGTEDGSQTNPYKSLVNAYGALMTTEKGGTVDNQQIVIMEDIDLNKEGFLKTPPSEGLKISGCDDKPVTITAFDGVTGYKVDNLYAALLFKPSTGDGNSAPFMLTGDLKLENVTLKGNGNTDGYITCQGWNFTVDRGVQVTNFLVSSGASDNGTFALKNNPSYVSYPKLHIMAGYMDSGLTTSDGSMVYPHDTCNIVVRSGQFARILGGSRSSGLNIQAVNKHDNTLGDAAHPFHVNILVDMENPAGNALDINQITGGQTDGNCYMDSRVTIRKGKVGRLIGGNISYGRQTSGENTPRNTFFGKVVLNIEGGTVHALYGQNLGRVDGTDMKSLAWFYGKTEINISGDSTVVGIPAEIDKGSNAVTGLYAGSSNGQSGYDAASTDPNRDLGKEFMETMGWERTETTMNISGGTFYQPLYGAGYGYSEYVDNQYCDTDAGCLNGDVYMNISGGTFLDNVFGGARGTDAYYKQNASLNALAQVKGNITVNITGGTFEKNVYGGSLGFGDPLLLDMAKVTGNINLNIRGAGTTVAGNVYGGGRNAKVEGDTYVTIGGVTSGN